MSNFGEKSKDIAEINEKLYMDSYFRLLKSKDKNLSEAPDVLRDLINQLNAHCKYLNISEESAEKFKNELITEYHNIKDNEAYPGLLPVSSDPETKITESVCCSQESIQNNHKVKLAVLELNSYLNSLKINLPSLNSVKPIIIQNKSIDMNASKPTTSNSAAIRSNFRPQFKSYGAGVGGSKRMVSDNEDSNSEHSAKKCNRWNNNKKAVAQSNNESSKSSATGFMSASSMYRNPLKKANEDAKPSRNNSPEVSKDNELSNHESLKHFDKKIVDVIFNEIMDFSPDIKWSDIAGLEFVKTTVQEIVIWPLLRPDIFTGLRAPPRGILLFGPPGTGKTLIGKCIATESNSTFFCISASSLASKWVGESEQLVRALFTVANLNQPAVIFIDEIDSLLSQRSDKDQDFTRKLKTEFLVQFDGAKTSSESRVLVVGATNRPHELDEAARRRFVKRLYVPLPEESARRQIVQKLLSAHQHNLSDTDLQQICKETNGYSCSDVTHLCKEAAMGPIRSIGPENIKTVSINQVRPIILNDFLDALRQVRASVAEDDLNYYLEWNKKFGSFGA